jgi:peroxiredoxin
MTNPTRTSPHGEGTLAAALAEQFEGFLAQAPKEVAELILGAVRDLAASGIEERALKVGDTAPDFTLNDIHGNPVTLSDLLRQGPVVVSFFRGGWCPYCKLEARALNAALPEITALGARLVSISPESNEATRETIRNFDMRFQVLPDTTGEVLDAFGLRFALTDEVKALYRGFGTDLAAVNATGRWELPIPATYVIGTDGKVVAAKVSVDYTTRMEPSAIIAALKAL